MLIELRNVSLALAERRLFEDLNLTVSAGDRIALVGHNGCGKSTLLSLLAGERPVDAGEVRRKRGLRVSRVRQFVEPELALSSVAELLDAELGERSWQGFAQLDRLGLSGEQTQTLVGDLSGGQVNRLLFALALAEDADLLLLDEPTNHLDLESLLAFEAALETYPGAVVLVSHDRAFLDAVGRSTFFLRDGQVSRYELDFSAARHQLALDDEARAHARSVEEKQIEGLRRSAAQMTAWSRAHESEKLARRARSMQRRVERLEAERTEVAVGSKLDLDLTLGRSSARQILRVSDLEVGYPGHTLFQIEELTVRPGDRIALLGANGVGKSTFITRLVAAAGAIEGETIRYSPQTRLGYYDQELTEVAGAVSAIDFLAERCGRDTQSLRSALVATGFDFAMHDQAVNTLSGGERARLLILALALGNVNFLILDEPTNHIDIDGKEQLEAQLSDGSATLLVTSHDRYFIDAVANRFLWIVEGGLRELSDAEPYYRWLVSQRDSEQSAQQALSESPGRLSARGQRVGSGENKSAEPSGESLGSEDAMLARIVDLEKLLADDQARKPKFQKPERQRRWRQELTELYGALET